MQEDIHTENDKAAIKSRTVKLGTSSKGITYFLEAKYGALKGIVGRRADGKSVTIPPALEGSFTDERNARAAVETHLAGKPKQVPNVESGVMDFGDAEVGEFSEEVIEVNDVPAVLNVSEGKDAPDGETVTQRALRQRLAGETITAEPDAVILDEIVEEVMAPTPVRRGRKAAAK